MNVNGRHNDLDVSKPPKLVRATSASQEERIFPTSGSVIVNGHSDSRYHSMANGVISTAATQTEDDESSSQSDENSEQSKILASKVTFLCSRVDHLEEKLSFVNRELHLVRDLLQCLTRLVPVSRELKVDGHTVPRYDRCCPNDVPRFQSQNRLSSSSSHLESLSPHCDRSSTKDVPAFEAVNRCNSPSDRPELLRIPRGANFGESIHVHKTKTTVMMPSTSPNIPNVLGSGFRDGIVGHRKPLTIEEKESGYERHPHGLELAGEKAPHPWETNVKSHPRNSSESKMHDPLEYLSSDLSALDAIFLWEHGTKDVPPIRLWNTNFSSGNRTRLLNWQRLVHIFNNECNSDVKRFVAENSDKDGELLSISSILAKYEDDQCLSDDGSSKSPPGDSIFRDDTKVDSKASLRDSVTGRLSQPRSPYFILPRKINGKKISALDVINIWENGFSDIPPIKKWTPAQKLKQQSKISRWKKIIDILNIECGGDLQKFENKYLTSTGTLMPVAAIIAKYEAEQAQRDDYGNISSNFNYTVGNNTLPTMTSQQSSYSISSPTPEIKAERVAREKYSVEYDYAEPSPKRHCVEVSYSLQRSNECTSLSPELRTTHFSRHQSLSGKESNDHSCHSSPSISKGSNGYTAESTVSSSLSQGGEEMGESNVLEDRRDFVLPTQVDALDVIRLWEHGSDTFPAIKCWTPSQKLAQRSKISRWNKIVDIYRFECSGDLRIFQENYSNSKGELLPITSIIAKYCSEKEAQSPDCLFISDSEPLIDVCTVGGPNDRSSPSSSSYIPHENGRVHFLKTDDPPLHVLPRKINGRKVSAKDVIQIWNHGLNNIPPVVNWSPQQKVKQQSKISRWKKIVDIFQHDCHGNMEHFESKYSNKLGELLPIAAIIAKNETERVDQVGDNGNKIEM